MQARTKTHRTKVSDRQSDTPMSAGEMIRKISGDLPKWAVMLKGLRHREGLTQVQLGEALSIEQTNISLMERGKRSIGKQLAKRLADFFKTDYRLFL